MLPVSALLSFALVAFTIEADNESERRIPHRTTSHGVSADRGPWLVSMAMWFNCLRWIPEQGIVVRDVERLARTRTNWDGMRRWGHIYFEPNPTDKRPKPPQAALLARTTAKGAVGREVWRTLIPEIEGRWRERFGAGPVVELRKALIAVARQLDPALPDCLPILRYGLVNEKLKGAGPGTEDAVIDELPLPALLARVLLAFALEYERESAVSLAIGADVLRVIGDQGTAVRDLPVRSGVSKEAVAMALGFLTKRGDVMVQTEGKAKKVRLTPKGTLTQALHSRTITSIEARWVERYGEAAMECLRTSLAVLTGDGTAGHSPLFAGLEPYAECWRSQVRRPETLPHFPMVLHRGGYPDGS